MICRTNSLGNTNWRCYRPSTRTYSTFEPWTPPRQVNTTTFWSEFLKLTPLPARTSFTSHRDVLKGEYPYGNSFSNMSMIVLNTLASPNATSMQLPFSGGHKCDRTLIFMSAPATNVKRTKTQLPYQLAIPSTYPFPPMPTNHLQLTSLDPFPNPKDLKASL